MFAPEQYVFLLTIRMNTSKHAIDFIMKKHRIRSNVKKELKYRLKNNKISSKKKLLKHLTSTQVGLESKMYLLMLMLMETKILPNNQILCQKNKNKQYFIRR